MLGVLHMEHHAPIIEETKKEVCFQTLALPINTIDVLNHLWTISDRHFIHSCTKIIQLFSFTNIPWTPVITTLIQHQSWLLSSRPAKSPGSSDVLGCKEAAGHRQKLCDYCSSAKPSHCPHLQSEKCHICPQQELIWSTPHIISRNGVYQINK